MRCDVIAACPLTVGTLRVSHITFFLRFSPPTDHFPDVADGEVPLLSDTDTPRSAVAELLLLLVAFIVVVRLFFLLCSFSFSFFLLARHRRRSRRSPRQLLVRIAFGPPPLIGSSWSC